MAQWQWRWLDRAGHIAVLLGGWVVRASSERGEQQWARRSYSI